MFLYWDGYEIDGSDTDFDIVLPENVQLSEFVESFLDIPLFTDTPNPEFRSCHTDCLGIWHNEKCKNIMREELIGELLSSSQTRSLAITVNCLHPDLLSKDLHSEVYAISSRRKFIVDPDYYPMPEEPFDHTKIENPCTAPVIQKHFDRGGVTMQLIINKNANTNVNLSLNVGPGAYFEYTMYVIDYMKERFPSINTDLDGGLDTCGCTFSLSLYAYEKVQLTVKYSVKHTLKHLTELGLMSYRRFYNKGWKHSDIANGFFESKELQHYEKSDTHIPFDDYIALVEMVTSSDLTPTMQIFETAVDIILPAPEMYKENSEAMQILQQVIPPLPPVYENRNKEEIEGIITWNRTGYMAFFSTDDSTICELRVFAKMKPYLQTWLKLAESGLIEFIKPTMYKRRKEDDQADLKAHLPKKKRK